MLRLCAPVHDRCSPIVAPLPPPRIVTHMLGGDIFFRDLPHLNQSTTRRQPVRTFCRVVWSSGLRGLVVACVSAARSSFELVGRWCFVSASVCQKSELSLLDECNRNRWFLATVKVVLVSIQVFDVGELIVVWGLSGKSGVCYTSNTR